MMASMEGLRNAGARRLRADVVRPRTHRALLDVWRLLPPAVQSAERELGRLVRRAVRRPRSGCGDGRVRELCGVAAGRPAGGRTPARPASSPAPTSTRCWTGGVRRAAGGGLRAGGDRRAAVSRGSCRRGRSGSGCSSRRRARGSGWPASARGWRPARRPGRTRGSFATGTASRSATSRRAAGRGCWTVGHVRRAARRAGPRPGRPGRRGRGGQRDLAARALPVRLHREANHAGTTRMEDRHDPMLTYAMTALAANKQARLRARGRPSGGSRSSPTAPTPSPCG